MEVLSAILQAAKDLQSNCNAEKLKPHARKLRMLCAGLEHIVDDTWILRLRDETGNHKETAEQIVKEHNAAIAAGKR